MNGRGRLPDDGTARGDGEVLPAECGAAAGGDCRELPEAALDEALIRLPEEYRDAVVLVHLEGRDPTEVAGELELTVEALSARLDRAMEMLRTRLDDGEDAAAGDLVALLEAEAITGAGGAARLLESMAAAGGRLALPGSRAELLAKGVETMMAAGKLTFCVALACLATALTGGVLRDNRPLAGEPTGKAPAAGEQLVVKPVLKPDPAVVKILSSLGENQSALLPAVKTAGNMNNAEVKKFGLDKTGPRPRDYCLKWVWAADRKRALFCGGNAGVPHKLNDVWEYDLASNTWVLLWEPDPDTNRVRRMKKPGEAKAYLEEFVKLDEESGEIMTRRGAPFDPVHTWWGLTYDPEMHALLWVQGNHHLHNRFLALHPELKPKYKLGGFHKMRLFAYYPYRGKWEFMKYPAGLRKSPAAILDYVPDLGGSLYYTQCHAQQGVLDSKTRKWKYRKLSSSSTRLRKEHPECPPREAVSAYDSAKRVLVVHHGGGTHRGKPVPKRTYHYDVKADKWQKVLHSSEGPRGFDAAGPMVYDSVAGKCFIVHDGLWAYGTAEKKWEKLAPDGPKAPRGMGCYNPTHNVLMVDSGRGRVWVYRHKLRRNGEKK